MAYAILDPEHADPSFTSICALAIMAKVPRPRKVKTRLSPPLTPHQAGLRVFRPLCPGERDQDRLALCPVGTHPASSRTPPRLCLSLYIHLCRRIRNSGLLEREGGQLRIHTASDPVLAKSLPFTGGRRVASRRALSGVRDDAHLLSALSLVCRVADPVWCGAS